MSFLLRPYQAAAVDAAMRELSARRRAVVVMATGGGKTIVFACIAEHWRSRGRVLVLAHREELISQAADKIGASTLLTTGIEQADRRVRQPLPDVVIASVQTLASARRREAFARDAFDLVIVDECHHAAADSYRTVLDYFAGAARLGVTATPDRGDGSPLSPVLGQTVYRYPLRRAVRDGYLVDVRRRVELLAGLDLARVSVRAGDYDAAELEAEMVKAPAVAAVADSILRHVGERPAVLFCAGVLHSKAVAAALAARKPGCATFASGEERDGVAALVSGRVQILCNADLTTEGFDHPPVALIGLVRPTKSIGRATQQVGRGTRLHPGKSDLVVVEFVSANAAEQVSTVDVVGSDLPPRVRQAAETMLDRQPSLSVLDALERAAAAAGTAAIAPRRDRAVVDPMKIVLGLDGMVMVPPTPGARAATSAQIERLEAAGLRPAGLDIRQAQYLIQGLQWRQHHRRSSPAEALDLCRFGFDPDCTATEAARCLSQMRAA